MIARRADHGLRRRRQGARLHLRRRLRRRDRARDRARSPTGRVANETINLAYGQGNTLVRAAELIAARARRRAGDHDRAVAARRGDALRRRHPQGARRCSAGSRRCRSTRASRARSPGSRSTAPPIRRRDRPVANEGDSARLEDARSRPVPSVLGIFGPTASGKTAGRRGDRGADSGGARLRRLDAGLPRPADPDEPGTPARGSSGSGRSTARARSASSVHSAHAAIATRSPRRGGRRSSLGGPGLWFQAALTDVQSAGRRAGGRQARAGERLYDRRGAETAHAILSGATSVRPRACTRTTASASFGRSSSGAGGRHARAGAAAALDRRAAAAGLHRRPRRARARRWQRSHRAHAPHDVRAGVEEEVRAAGDVVAAGARPRRRPGRCRATGGDRRARARARCASPRTSASGCAGSRASS